MQVSDYCVSCAARRFFLLWASALIFMMQAGFATLSAGSIRAKNVKNILLKNVLDACVGAIVWYCVGYGLAYDADNGVNGPCNAASRDTLIGPSSS